MFALLRARPQLRGAVTARYGLPGLNSSCRRFASNQGSYNLLAADRSNSMQSIYHKTSLLSLAVAPVALVCHPSPLSLPLDLTLSVLFPLHAHIGISWILTDYMKSAKPSGGIRIALLGFSVLASLGLIKVSLSDDGLVGTVKATWKKPDVIDRR